jgi:hypothetical protein
LFPPTKSAKVALRAYSFNGKTSVSKTEVPGSSPGGPASKTKTALSGGISLFLRFLVEDALAKRRIKLLELDLALDFLLVLAAEVRVVRLRGLQLDKAVL